MTVAVMALLLNSRHIFYGIPFIEKWKDYGAAKWFLIFALPDEAFSLHISSEYDEKLVYIFNAFYVLIYWLIISILGGLLGSLIRFPTEGMDFALTALFIVIVFGTAEDIKKLCTGSYCGNFVGIMPDCYWSGLFYTSFFGYYRYGVDAHAEKAGGGR